MNGYPALLLDKDMGNEHTNLFKVITPLGNTLLYVNERGMSPRPRVWIENAPRPKKTVYANFWRYRGSSEDEHGEAYYYDTAEAANAAVSKIDRAFDPEKMFLGIAVPVEIYAD
jgi:hypothetical protein